MDLYEWIYTSSSLFQNLSPKIQLGPGRNEKHVVATGEGG